MLEAAKHWNLRRDGGEEEEEEWWRESETISNLIYQCKKINELLAEHVAPYALLWRGSVNENNDAEDVIVIQWRTGSGLWVNTLAPPERLTLQGPFLKRIIYLMGAFRSKLLTVFFLDNRAECCCLRLLQHTFHSTHTCFYLSLLPLFLSAICIWGRGDEWRYSYCNRLQISFTVFQLSMFHFHQKGQVISCR